MNFIESLEFYTESQKVIAFGFIGYGIALLSFALLLFVKPFDLPLWSGIKVGSLFFGLFILAGGIGYLSFCGKTHEQIKSGYEASPSKVITHELARMEKVVSDFSTYQFVFAFIVLIALATILFAKPYWVGIAFPAAFLFVAVLLIEAHSKVSIDQHYEFVSSIQDNLNH